MFIIDEHCNDIKIDDLKIDYIYYTKSATVLLNLPKSENFDFNMSGYTLVHQSHIPGSIKAPNPDQLYAFYKQFVTNTPQDIPEIDIDDALIDHGYTDYVDINAIN